MKVADTTAMQGNKNNWGSGAKWLRLWTEDKECGRAWGSSGNHLQRVTGNALAKVVSPECWEDPEGVGPERAFNFQIAFPGALPTARLTAA